ncbi:MAG: hypothetical protein J0L92_32535, partial [Deltaproteobacteria bacterium]|nr:hypothetical protein [Deltaproteobacteria bacterium]
MRHATLLLAALLFSLPVTARAVDVTEPPDLSGDVGSPSAVTLTNGRNTVSGTLATPDDRQDNFTVTVPTGHRLRAVRLTIEGGGFIGAVTFNLSESRTSSGPFTMGLPMPAGTYYVQVVTDFSTGTSWTMSFFVAPEDAGPICGDGALDAGEGCDDGNATECDGCSNACTVVVSGCQIEGACVAEAAAHPTIDCIGCNPERSRTAWSPLPRDRRCDDDTFCTERDACDGAGNCAGIPRTCDDGDACTTDACDETSAMCTAAPIPLCGVDAGMDAGAITSDAGATTEDDAGRVG